MYYVHACYTLVNANLMNDKKMSDEFTKLLFHALIALWHMHHIYARAAHQLSKIKALSASAVIIHSMQIQLCTMHVILYIAQLMQAFV